MSVTKQEVVDFIKGMTVLELSEFVKELEQTFGVSAAAPVAMAAMPGAAAEAVVVEEQTEFSVIITGVGDKKINVIKEVLAITSLGLKEAKDLVEKVPGTVRKAFPRLRPKRLQNSLQRQVQPSRSNRSYKFARYRKSAACAGLTGRFPIFYFLAAYQREVTEGQGFGEKLPFDPSQFHLQERICPLR